MYQIISQLEYEEMMNLFLSIKPVPTYGVAYIQWLELKNAIEKWEDNHRNPVYDSNGDLW